MALWLVSGGTEAKPRIFVAKLSHSFARNKDSSEAEKHGSEAVRLSKLHDEKPCCKFMPLTFPSRRSTSGKLRSAPRGGGDKDAADWISEAVKDPLVEIDPITMARHLAASDGASPKSSSFVSASRQPLTYFFRSTGPGGFPGYVLALGAAVVLVILATAVHLFRIRKQAEENVAHYESSSDEEGNLDLLSIMENEENVELASASSLESRKNFQSQENDETKNFRRDQQSLENTNVNGNEQRNEQKQVSPETLAAGAAQKRPDNSLERPRTFGNDEKTLEQVSAEVDGVADRLKNSEESFGRGQENLINKVSYEFVTAAGQQYDHKNNQEKLESRKDDLQNQIALEVTAAAEQEVLENSQESGLRNIKNDQKRLEQVSQVDSTEQEVFEIDDQESKQGTLTNNHQPLNRQEQVSPDPQVVTEQEGFENDDQERKQGTLKRNHQRLDRRGQVSPEVVYAAAVAALVQSDEFQVAFRKTRQSREETPHERPLPLPPSRSKDLLLETAEGLNVEGMTLEELMLEEQSIAELDKPDIKTLPDSLTLRKQDDAELPGEPGNAEEDVIELRNADTVQDQDNGTELFNNGFKLQSSDQDNIDETPQDLTAPFKNLEDMDAEYVSLQEEEALRRQSEFRRKLETLCLAAFVFVFSGVPGTELDPDEDGITYDPDTRRKIVQAALPAVAVGAGALSVITGVEGAFEMVGFTATAGFIYYELLYADSRRDLWQDLGKVKDHRKLVEFLKSKNIVG